MVPGPLAVLDGAWDRHDFADVQVSKLQDREKLDLLRGRPNDWNNLGAARQKVVHLGGGRGFVADAPRVYHAEGDSPRSNGQPKGSCLHYFSSNAVRRDAICRGFYRGEKRRLMTVLLRVTCASPPDDSDMMLQATFTSRRLFFRLVRPAVSLTQRTTKPLPYRTTTTDAVRKPALRGSRGVTCAPTSSAVSSPRIPARDPRPRDKAPAGRLRILCAGCGAGLQTRDHVAAGYIPTLKRLEELQVQAAEALARADAGAVDMHANTFRGHGVVCQRCFQAKHYGRLVPLTIPEATFAEYLAGLRAVPALILLVCDVFDFHATLLTNLRSLLEEPPSSGRGQGRAASAGAHRSHDVIMVVNKIDLLPKATSLKRLEVWVRTEARRLGE